MIPPLARVDLESMAMKGYTASPKAPALQEPHDQIAYCYIQDPRYKESYPSAEMQSVYPTTSANWSSKTGASLSDSFESHPVIHWGEVFLVSRDAVNVFYSSSRMWLLFTWWNLEMTKQQNDESPCYYQRCTRIHTQLLANWKHFHRGSFLHCQL